MEVELFLSNIITEEEIDNIVPGSFNVLNAPRGWGKTTFMFDDRILKFSRACKHVLYLVQNKVTRDSIVLKNFDRAVVFEDRNDEGWFTKRQKEMWTIEEDTNKIHVMCYQTFAAILRNEGVRWLDDIDLIIWDEFDDIYSYYERDLKQIKKMLPKFSRDRLVALLQEGKPTSVVNLVYQIKTYVLDPKRIKLIAISATPQRAIFYFRDYVNYVLNGQLENRYAAQETIYINNVVEAIKNKTIRPGRRYWCFTRYVTDAFRIGAVAAGHSLNPLVLWSDKNQDWAHLMTPERKAALKYLQENKAVPPEYDMLIITGVGNRSIDIYDDTIQDWICNSTEYEEIEQFIRARFSPERQYLLESTRGLVDFIQNGFPIDYYEWHTLDELRQLVEDKPIYSKDPTELKKLTSFNAIRREYPDLFEIRKYGKARLTQYRIKPAL